MKFSSKKEKKALIIGLDGVPYSLLNHYLKSGLLPNLEKIISDGLSLYQMNASIPDVSSVSWSSFVTGVNPGEHGIYGFTDLYSNSYSLYFPNANDRKAPPFWEILGGTNEKNSTLSQKYMNKMDRPYRSIIINVPHTYPANPIQGIMVSGFVAIDLKRATFPESAYAYLHSMNYLIDVDAENARENLDVFMNRLFECFEIRKRAISYFFEKESWDLFFACITETDRLHHFFFDASVDDAHPYHERFRNFYMKLDEWIKTLYEGFQRKYSENTFLMILSDHGFTQVRYEVYLNRFFEEMGLLKLRESGEFYEKIDAGTKVFNLDPARIYINDTSYSRGSVREEEKAELLKRIKRELKNLKGPDGQHVIDLIYEKEEIYNGPHVDRGPDLVCVARDGYDIKGSLDKKEVWGPNNFAGMHTWHDAFCILSEEIKFSEKPSIERLADFILKYFSK